MIRINRKYPECRQCEAFKPILSTLRIRDDGEITDQYVQIECGNQWVCGQIRKVIDRGKSGQDEED